MTVADSTFIVNRSVQVTESPTNTAALEDKALVFVKQGDYNKKYSVQCTVNVINSDAAQITANLTSYAAFIVNGVATYRWKISSLTIDDGGSGYGTTAPIISFNSTLDTYTPAEYTANLSGGW